MAWVFCPDLMPFVAFLGVLGSREGCFLGGVWRSWATVGVIFEGYLAWLCDREGRPYGKTLVAISSTARAVSRAFTLLFRVSG